MISIINRGNFLDSQVCSSVIDFLEKKEESFLSDYRSSENKRSVKVIKALTFAAVLLASILLRIAAVAEPILICIPAHIAYAIIDKKPMLLLEAVPMTLANFAVNLVVGFIIGVPVNIILKISSSFIVAHYTSRKSEIPLEEL